MLAGSEDTVLITRTMAGDQQAFAVLVERYQHMVYGLALRILRTPQDAEEAAQDSFVKAYRHLPSYAGNSKFSTWLYSIAYRTALSKLRNRPAATADVLDHHQVLAIGSVTDVLEADERKRGLAMAMDALPPEDAALIGLYHLQELSVEEIVTVTGLSASNVKVKLHRTRKRLLELLDPELRPQA